MTDIEEQYKKKVKELHNKILKEMPYNWVTLICLGILVFLMTILIVVAFWNLYIVEVTILGIVFNSITIMLIAYMGTFFLESFIDEIKIHKALYKAKRS